MKMSTEVLEFGSSFVADAPLFKVQLCTVSNGTFLGTFPKPRYRGDLPSSGKIKRGTSSMSLHSRRRLRYTSGLTDGPEACDFVRGCLGSAQLRSVPNLDN